MKQPLQTKQAGGDMSLSRKPHLLKDSSLAVHYTYRTTLAPQNPNTINSNVKLLDIHKYTSIPACDNNALTPFCFQLNKEKCCRVTVADWKKINGKGPFTASVVARNGKLKSSTSGTFMLLSTQYQVIL
ncbi:hypothetical protein J6590_100597 [Homalodisca vitripennis]|nr:hypothetical protein J6590_100597 [Homalodisca vitripennis]